MRANGRRGLGVWLALGLLSAAAPAACGRSSADASKEPAAAGGESSGATSAGGEPQTAGHAHDDDVQHPSNGGALGDGGESSDDVQCDPGAVTCDGPSVRRCSKDGSSSTIVETCSLSQTCSQGACQDIECVPQSTFCRGGQILECNEDGTSGTLVQDCEGDEFCLLRDGEARCSESPCIANEPLCLNQAATTCKTDGSGPMPGGKDCSLSLEVCDQGVCIDPSCAPGEKFCEHDDVYLCLGSGADAALFTACGDDEACDPTLAACREKLCEPGKLGCDDSRVATCNDLGLGWEQTGKDCYATNQLCINGGCKTQICTPSATFCQDGDVYQCDANGVTVTLSEACNDAYYHCAPHYYYANQAYCTSNSCTPGATLCNGNVLSKCNSDGSGYEPGGSDCGSDKICYNNSSCETKVCEPYSYFCKNGDIYSCNYYGLESYLYVDCSDGRCGKDDNGYTVCLPDDCSPGFKACLGNQIGTCSDDGITLSNVKQDCTATGEVCTSSSACGASAVDTLGVAEELQSLSDGQIFGDVIAVTSNRRLTQLEANLVLASGRTLRWVVFELINNTFDARYDKVVADQSGSGYLSSGPISYALKAGHTYLLGVAVTGGGFVPYYDATPWQPEVSFGQARGGLSATYYTSIYNYGTSAQLYDMRVTTELP